jgi:alcohol dehydrogenase class IV
MLCLQATSKLFKYLPLYKDSPTNKEYITELQLAAFASLGLFGYAPKTPLGLSHTLGYALGSPYGIPHGITSCLTLGHVIKLKARSDAQAARQLARVAPFVNGGLKGTGSELGDAEAVGDAVLGLVERLGLKTTLTERGVGEDQVQIIVKRALGGQESGKLFDAVEELVRGLY